MMMINLLRAYFHYFDDINQKFILFNTSTDTAIMHANFL